jgi:hypothetical protein
MMYFEKRSVTASHIFGVMEEMPKSLSLVRLDLLPSSEKWLKLFQIYSFVVQLLSSIGRVDILRLVPKEEKDLRCLLMPRVPLLQFLR